MQKVKKAVFPVAGLGTRFLPATKASPKEMLPIVDKPLIQYAVEEAMDAGITDIIFISSRTKRTVEDHFDKAYELETELAARGKNRDLELVQSIRPAGVNFIYIRQAEALGLGHAVLCAQPVIGKSGNLVFGPGGQGSVGRPGAPGSAASIGNGAQAGALLPTPHSSNPAAQRVPG